MNKSTQPERRKINRVQIGGDFRHNFQLKWSWAEKPCVHFSYSYWLRGRQETQCAVRLLPKSSQGVPCGDLGWVCLLTPFLCITAGRRRQRLPERFDRMAKVLKDDLMPVRSPGWTGLKISPWQGAAWEEPRVTVFVLGVSALISSKLFHIFPTVFSCTNAQIPKQLNEKA